jgi:hypothetical protein
MADNDDEEYKPTEDPDDDATDASSTDETKVAHVVADSDNNSNTLYSIFDDDKITKYYDKNNKQRWRCGWCNSTFGGWNATKAIHHLNKTQKQDIKPCKVKYDRKHTALYSDIYKKFLLKRSGAAKTASHVQREIETHNDNSASMLDEKRSTSSHLSNSTKRARLSFCDGDTTNLVSFISGSSNVASEISGSTNTVASNNSRGFIQRLIHDGPNPTSDSKLTMAIADMIHGCGLAFSLVSDPKFRKVIQLAKTVGSGYQLPSRNTVAGELLDLNYEMYQKKHMNC